MTNAAISIKDDSIGFSGMQPQITLAMFIVSQVYFDYGYHELVITSINDGTHSRTSNHNKGMAVDFRGSIAWGFTRESLERIVEEARKRLGRHFDIILEPDHIHLEYDPKT